MNNNATAKAITIKNAPTSQSSGAADRHQAATPVVPAT
jgi:hypothetical protein